jgi:uncharacterized caspase-like protein
MQKGDVLVFVFAGHGFQIDGVQYLMPKDAFFDDRSLEAAAAASIRLPALKIIAREYAVSSVWYILDVCRTFPLQAGTKTSVLHANVEGGQSYEVNDQGLFLPRVTQALRAARKVTATVKGAAVEQQSSWTRRPQHRPTAGGDDAGRHI